MPQRRRQQPDIGEQLATRTASYFGRKGGTYLGQQLGSYLDTSSLLGGILGGTGSAIAPATISGFATGGIPASAGAQMGQFAGGLEGIGGVASGTSGGFFSSLAPALGWGSLGGLGYTTLGRALGLPQGGYSGIGSTLGGIGGYLGGSALGSSIGGGAGAAGAAGGAAAGASWGSVVPVVGTILGAVLGGVVGSLFGGEEEHEPHLDYSAELGYNPKTGQFESGATGSAYLRGGNISHVGPRMGSAFEQAMAGYGGKFNRLLDIPTVKQEQFNVGGFSQSGHYHGDEPEEWMQQEMGKLHKRMRGYKSTVHEALKNAGLYTNIGPLASAIGKANQPYFSTWRH